ncbi:hypothetical protein SUSAZ_09580 [Sulfolobus acidocaldarius SUSAZ]|nr:hypothetical protein SUSAZ_09580 [Sulfolobus acidocaldarius SUSAZ]
MLNYLNDYLALGFSPSTILGTCELSEQFEIYHGEKGEEVSLFFIKSSKPIEKRSKINIHYFSPKLEVIIERSVKLNGEALVSASTLRIVDITFPPESEIYDGLLRGLVLNPIVVKGAVDNLYFKREDILFGWGLGEGIAKLGKFEPSDYCIIQPLGELAFISLYNRFVMGRLTLDESYVRREKEKILEISSKVYRELGEVVIENENNLAYVEDIGMSQDSIERLKTLKIKTIIVHDKNIFELTKNFTKNPFASPFSVVILGNKIGVDRVVDKALSLGLRVFRSNFSN